MNYRPVAAKAALALALTLTSGALYAGNNAKGECTCVEYEEANDTVQGISANWQMQRLRHINSTLHKYIGNPNEFGSAVCRAIAVSWNVGVFLNRSDQHFTRLIKKSASRNCKIEFERVATANSDGSFDLVWVRPSP